MLPLKALTFECVIKAIKHKACEVVLSAVACGRFFLGNISD